MKTILHWLHIVHYNTKYSSISEAVAQKDGLAVFGFIYLISELNNVNYTNIVENLRHVQVKDTKISLKPGKLESLLPEKYIHFYRYSGSLTTPPCDESVTWTLFTDPIYISEIQLNEFRQLLDSNNHTMMNYRPIQPINKRIVTANFDPHIHWQYGNAEQWEVMYESCGGKSQSPINIENNNTLPETNLPLMAFHNYEKPALSGMILKNNGHTVELEFVGDEIAIYAGGLPEPYIVKQLHFHWGEDSARGSEHQVDSQSFPMELHIVHYRKSLKNFTAAASKYHGLAVLGFFFEISSGENIGLKQIIYNLNNVDVPGKWTSIPAFSLNSFLPLHRSDFYRYDGSLTTPGCTESVIWTVFKDTIKISKKQLAAFDQVQTIDGGIQKPMVNNYRPVQPLNLRVVRRNFNVPPPKIHWSYEGSHGTDHWPNVYKFCSNSVTSRQSPIDINYDSMKYVTLDNLHMEGYESVNGVTLVLKNNGHA
ncbi:Carbonic anhydrase 14, partial [Bulinus truncatus]